MRLSLRTLITLSLLLSAVLSSSVVHAADKPIMSFTSIRDGSAQKQWSTEDCTGSMTGAKTLTIVGSFPTGRTDHLKDQKLVITIVNFHGTDTYTGGMTQTYFEDLFGAQKIKATFRSGTVVITDFNLNTGLLSGTFSLLLESHPPNLETFKTAITAGTFSARFENELQVLVAPGKNPFNTNAKTKVNYKVKITDLFGNLVEGANVSYTDEINNKKNEKLGTTSANGELIYELEIAETVKSADYELSFSATKDKYKTSQLVKKTVSVSGRYWVYKCAGLPLLTFDAGQGNEWKKEDDNSPILSHKGSAKINEILELKGEIKIDPTAGQEALSGTYDIVIPEMKEGAGKVVVDLIVGKALNFALSCDTKFKLLTPELLKKKIGGSEFSLEEFSFQDLDFGTALVIKGKANWENVKQNACEGQSNTPDKGEVEIGLSIVKEELGGVSFGKMSISFTDCVIPAFPQFCVTQLAGSYDNVKDQFMIAGGCAFKAGAGVKKAWDATIKGSLTIEKSKFDGFTFEGSTNPGVPVPEVPIFMWTGLKLGTSGWASDEWKAQSADITGVFTSVDDQLIKRVPKLESFLGKANICEVELGAKLTYPFIVEGGLKLSLFKIPRISVTRPWQIEASLKGSMDFVKGIRSKSQYIKAFHFGADDYIINIEKGSSQSVLWEDSFAFACSTVAKFRMPDIPGEMPDKTADGEDQTPAVWLMKAMKGLGILPHDLGYAGAYLRFNEKDGLVATGVVDLQQNPSSFIRSIGRLSVEASLSSDTGVHLWFHGFDKKLGFISHRSSNNEIQSLDDGGRRLIAASSLDSFKITPDVERVFVMVKSLSKIPATTLVSPAGDRITTTKSDSSVILFKSADSKIGFWSLINPAQGIWTVETVNPAKTDSVLIFGLSPNNSKPFSITASAVGRDLKVKWDKSLYSMGDRIDLFLNDELTGSGGIPIGYVDATLGEYSYTMSDSLPFCTCYVYGIRVVDGLPNDQAYVNTEFNTGRMFAPAPTNIVANSNGKGQTNVQWTPVSAPGILRYGIYVRTDDGTDSLLSTVPSSSSSAYIECDTTLLRTLFMVSFDSLYRKGCPRKSESITVDIKQHPDDLRAAMNSITVAPQPASDFLYFIAPSDFNGSYTCELYDYIGHKVVSKQVDAGTSGPIMLPVSELRSGCYILRLYTAQMHKEVLVTVLH